MSKTALLFRYMNNNGDFIIDKKPYLHSNKVIKNINYFKKELVCLFFLGILPRIHNTQVADQRLGTAALDTCSSIWNTVRAV